MIKFDNCKTVKSYITIIYFFDHCSFLSKKILQEDLKSN
jgi:hypothetical protein